MDLIDFCKFPPKEITPDNIFDYTNLDFSSELWPRGRSSLYTNQKMVKHICDHVIDIHAVPKGAAWCLFVKVDDIQENAECVINSGYYLDKVSVVTVSVAKYAKYENHQKYIKELVIDNPNYYPKNIIKYNYMLILLLWIMKYQKKVCQCIV